MEVLFIKFVFPDGQIRPFEVGVVPKEENYRRDGPVKSIVIHDDGFMGATINFEKDRWDVRGVPYTCWSKIP